ncbi:MAG: hypothetical protein R3C49_08700 [Planctomycetaceae bacterium]
MTIIGLKTRWSPLVATPLYMYFNLLDGVGTMTAARSLRRTCCGHADRFPLWGRVVHGWPG